MKVAIRGASQIDARVVLPGSKYIANRLLLMCALAESESRLTNVVNNHDIQTSIEGLRQLGYQFEQQSAELVIKPRVQQPDMKVKLYTAHSGTFSRFVSAIAALESVPVEIDCSAKMATRPMLELFAGLIELGVKIDSPNNCLPATITGPVIGETCAIDASRSSQYLSALMIIAPRLPQGLTIQLDNQVVSGAYVEMTTRFMQMMGVQVDQSAHAIKILPGQKYHGIDFQIPGDAVSASYFMGAAAISGGRVTIADFDFDSVQGEARFYQVLEQMGVTVTRLGNDLLISGPQQLKGIEVDMGDMPDAVQTLAAVACYTDGVTKITNIAHLAYKESNRIEDTAHELRKAGVRVDSGKDYLTIYGGSPHAATFETHEDHRMAMSLALLGIKTPGIQINNAQVVEKSFPEYWQYLTAIGIDVNTLVDD
ncbi:3-phosphoshikimate 1-carboxyvinyltransferase [Aliikangiella maris]|uniref:3-phosphoshikimate 1-carboxyvinyltransferase n=2 Tax=Aliikangiella maris TaxID=3162458 RepID=A0ABV3MI22_9GAMM